MKNEIKAISGIVGAGLVAGAGIVCTMGACDAVNQVCEENGVPRLKRWGTVVLTYLGGMAVTAQCVAGIGDLTVNSINKTEK